MMMSLQRGPEQVISSRGGSVLGRKTILKSDHFPGCQNKRLRPQIEGAPNYRQVVSLPVHGVAIPTIEGIRNVLDLIGAVKNGHQKRVIWHNLREEPLVYINGRPFVLREVERPFSNLEYTGINRVRVEEMEARLKEDILGEAARYANKILVTDELPDGQMVDQWEPISEDSVQTPLEVYEELKGEGYLVHYERVPITDEKSPKELDFDLLVHRVSQADVNTEIVFNCQMGRGRTTTGMVIATLVYLNRIGASGIPRSNSMGKVLECGSDIIDDIPDSEEALRRGEYTVIRSLIRVLEGGVEARITVVNYNLWKALQGKGSNRSCKYSEFWWHASHFHLAQGYTSLTLWRHCNESISGEGFQKWSLCGDDWYSISNSYSGRHLCQTSLQLPISSNLTIKQNDDLITALSLGFEITWSIDTNRDRSCGPCLDSKGSCGYDILKPTKFLCYCYDSTSSPDRCPANPDGRKSKYTIIVGCSLGVVLIALAWLFFAFNAKKKNPLPNSSTSTSKGENCLLENAY